MGISPRIRDGDVNERDDEGERRRERRLRRRRAREEITYLLC